MSRWTDATLFNEVMQIIWDGGVNDPSFRAKAIADKLNGRQHFNPENALAALRTAFPEAQCTPRMAKPEEFGGLPHNGVIFDVKFADDSRAVIEADQYGEGHGITYVD